MTIRSITSEDISWIQQVLQSLNFSWQEGLSGFLAEENGRKVGLITYFIDFPLLLGEGQGEVFSSNDKHLLNKYSTCHIVSINSLTPGRGIGSALLEKVEEEAKAKGCQKITVDSSEVTNDFFVNVGFTFSENKKRLQKFL